MARSVVNLAGLTMAITAAAMLIACGGSSSPKAAIAQSTTTTPAAQGTPAAQSTPCAASAGLTAKCNTLLNVEQLSDIQPGLGTVMFEYSIRYGRLWFALQAGNWDMARYELLEMREDQEVGETTKPNRASSLKTFETNYLDPLAADLDKHDLTAAQTAFKDGITGCNSCHKRQTSTDFPGGYKFIKVQVPQTSPEDIVTFVGQ